MAKEDIVHEAVERLEWDERRRDDTPQRRALQISRRAALTGGAAGIAALALEACGGSSSSSSSASASTGGSSAAAGVFGDSSKYKFTMVNHVTTNVFFTPTQNGAADACKLLGCSYQWTGSQSSNVGQMVDQINTAVNARVDGIATSLIAKTSFNKPIAAALKAGIPVVSYNAAEPTAGALSYIGQDLFQAGVQLGQHVQQLLPNGGEIALFIATPGAANIQPRINGAQSVLKGNSKFKIDVVTTGASVPGEISAISQWAEGHSSAKGMFAVDGGSTEGVAEALRKQNLRSKGWKGGGFDLTPITEKLLSVGDLDFTIDQQPYLQGFLPILQLYLYKASGGLSGPADVDTGLKFIDKSTVGPYVSTKSRFEGTSSSAGVQKAS